VNRFIGRITFCAFIFSGGFLCAQCPPTFTYTLNGLQVHFNNQPDFLFPQSALFWDFGDGNSLLNQNDPIHTYASTGQYNVCMTSTSMGCNAGQPQVFCQAVNVTGALCIFDFTFTIVGNTVYFDNVPNATSPAIITWDFGDGGYFNANDPIKTYNNPGIYNVCMTVTNPLCGAQPITVCHTVDLSNADTCVFSISHIVDGLTGFFQNTPQLPADDIVWDFGNGDFTTGNNPTYTFWYPGDYIVCATAQLPQCSQNPLQMDCDTVTVTVPDSCLFSFSYSVTNNLTVAFNNEPDLQAPVSFYWDFGYIGGILSDVNDPVHTFPEAGTYYVCLYGYNLSCPDLPAYAFCEYISLVDPGPCTATFGYAIDSLTVYFSHNPIATSTNGFILDWSFGDGETATGNNPVHTYDQPGNYIVCLEFFNPSCTQAYLICDTVEVTGITNCFPQISHSLNGLTVYFQNTPDYSPSEAWFSWIFGDGSAALYTNDPVHTYSGFGSYLACFKLVDLHCSDSVIVCDTIKLAPGITVSIFPDDLFLFPNPVQHRLFIIIPEKIQSLEIMSSTGHLINPGPETYSTNNQNILSIETFQLAQGVYLLKIQTDRRVLVRKFLKI